MTFLAWSGGNTLLYMLYVRTGREQNRKIKNDNAVGQRTEAKSRGSSLQSPVYPQLYAKNIRKIVKVRKKL